MNKKPLILDFIPELTDTKPEDLLLLGGGITQPNRKWLSMPSVRVNCRTLFVDTFKNTPIHCMTVGRFQTRALLKICKDRNISTVIYELNHNVPPKGRQMVKDVLVLKKPLRRVRRIFLRPYTQVIGQWFQDKSDIAKAMRIKRFTSGFWLILWLLYGKQKRIYISGFDGYAWMRQYLSYIDEEQKANNLGRCNLTGRWHNINLEWIFWEEAIQIARKRGIEVKVAKNAKLFKSR